MGKVEGSGGGAGGGRKSRWKRFSRFFSCVGIGGEAASSFDHADAPVSPPVRPSAVPDLPPTAACDDDDDGLVDTAASDVPELPTSACDNSEFCSVPAARDQPEPEMPTAAGEEEYDESAAGTNLAASSDSIDLDVADYVERVRSVKRRDTSFGEIFTRVPGCRPNVLLHSHAAHLRDMAPWMELSFEVDSPVPRPDYNVEEFANVDVTCHHQALDDEAPDQSSNTQVTVNENIYSRWRTAAILKIVFGHNSAAGSFS